MQTLEFKAQSTNVFFTIVNQMSGGSSQLPATSEGEVIKSLSTVQTTKQCTTVVVSWEKLLNICLKEAKKAFVGWPLSLHIIEKWLIHVILLDFTEDLSYSVHAGAGGNNAGNFDHWAPAPTYSSDLSHHSAVSACTSSDRPLEPDIEREQCSTAASCQEHNMEQRDLLLQQPHFTSPSDLGRRWHHLRRRCYHQQRSRNFSFTVVSYNVLADGLLYSNSHLYGGTEEWVKHWEYRRRNLLKELSYYDADVS